MGTVKVAFSVKAMAIFNCVYFAVMPWWVYEENCHHKTTYWKHLLINLQYAGDWLNGNITQDDVDFVSTPVKYFRW